MDDEAYEKQLETEPHLSSTDKVEIEIDTSNTVESIYGPVKIQRNTLLRRKMD